MKNDEIKGYVKALRDGYSEDLETIVQGQTVQFNLINSALITVHKEIVDNLNDLLKFIETSSKEDLEKRVIKLEKKVAALEGPVQAQQDYDLLSQGKKSINQIRAEYGLNPIEDKSSDKLFITKE